MSKNVPDNLIGQLLSPDLKVRQRAIETMHQSNVEAFVNYFVKILRKGKDYWKCQASALALGALNAKYTLQPLSDLLLHHERWYVRTMVAEALGNLGVEDACEVLIHALHNDKDYNVRRAAAIALGRFHNKHAIEALLQALHQEKEPFVRQGIAKTLGSIAAQTGDIALTLLALNFHPEETIAGIEEAVLHRKAKEKLAHQMLEVLCRHPKIRTDPILYRRTVEIKHLTRLALQDEMSREP